MKGNIFQLGSREKYAAAVSGGSDSLAMLYMLVDMGYKDNITVLHFDHNLRKESANEAKWLRKQCEILGVQFVCEKWHKPNVEGNIQQEARYARYTFFKHACETNNLNSVLVAHTQDDLVETMLMRLGRGSGLTGLSAMSEETNVLGVSVYRPLLNETRETLQNYLKEKGVDYISDPSNDNEKFFRIRVRNLKPVLLNAGIAYEHIASSAKALRRADDALNFFADSLANHLIEEQGGKVNLSTDIFMYPEEIQLRLLATALFKVTSEGLAPRTSKRSQALLNMKDGIKGFTLGGAIFKQKSGFYQLEKEK